MIRLFSRRSKKTFNNTQSVSLIHLDPLTPSGSIEGWAYTPKDQSLKGEKVGFYTSSNGVKISGIIDTYRADVADFKRTDGYNGFHIGLPPVDDLRILLAPNLKASVAGMEAKIVFTDIHLLSLQVRQRIGDDLALSELVERFNESSSTALYWHYLITHELKREQSPQYLIDLVYSPNASLISSHRTRSEEIKLLLQYELYDDANQIYQRALNEASSRDEVEAFKIFKATYLGNQVRPAPLLTDHTANNDENSTLNQDRFQSITDLPSALNKILDLNYYNKLRHTTFKNQEHVFQYYIRDISANKVNPPNQTFDPNSLNKQ